MRHTFSSIGLALAALTLGSCSPGTAQNTPTVSGSQNPSALRANAAMRPSVSHLAGKLPHDLYVADRYYNAVLLLHNRTYSDDGLITSGINVPSAVFVDKKGHLYVANSGNVAEYAPGNTGGPIFTYSNNMTVPASVTADAYGNVFEADADGTINEYYQGLNLPAASCFVGSYRNASGIAVDAGGDVFVSTDGEPSQVMEYPGGLNGCNPNVLGVRPINKVGGMAIDAKGNLLVCDLSEVDVIAPPYSAITGTIGSGFVAAANVTLNKSNTEAYVTDTFYRTVTVDSYPGGTNLKVLGTADGLNNPRAAVDSPNAVY